MDDKSRFYTTTFDPKNLLTPKRTSVTLDLTECLTECKEVRIVVGEHFVATTPERFMECMSWLLTNVDTDTMVTKDGIEVE